jgi:large subunit ribosomal protein L21
VYAVLVTGGKQYKAQVGQVLTIEKLDVPAGQDVQFDQVLLISDDANVTVGAPLVDGAVVTGKVVRQDRGPKIIVFKYKPKVRYRRKTGHRQSQTHVLVQTIERDGTVLAMRSTRPAAATVVEETAPMEVAPEVTIPAESAPVEATAEETAPVEAGAVETNEADTAPLETAQEETAPETEPASEE